MKINFQLFLVLLILTLSCSNCDTLKLPCKPPTLTLDTELPNQNNPQEIAYRWNSILNATNYVLEVELNGNLIDQAILPQSTTEYLFETPNLEEGDQLVTSIFSVCNNEKELDTIFINNPPIVCEPPTELNLVKLTPQKNNNYNLTYSWPSVANADSFDFKFFINNKLQFSQQTSDTTISFAQSIPPNINIQATVGSICEGVFSKNVAESGCQIIITDDLVFRSEDGTPSYICDIDSRRYPYIQIEGEDLLIIDENSFMLNKPDLYYSTAVLKRCLCGINGRVSVDDVKRCFAVPGCDIIVKSRFFDQYEFDIFFPPQRNLLKK